MKVLMTSQSRKISHCQAHSHPCYELVVVTKGECTTIINDISYEMKKGTVLIIPPYAAHREYSNTSYSDIYIQYDEYHFITDLPLMLHDYSFYIARLADIIKNLFIKNEPGNREICSDLLSVIFSYISTLIKEKYSGSFVPILKNIMVENLSNPSFNIGKVIADLGYNQDYAARVFKADIGMTPHAYLTHLRLEQAKRLLLNNDYYTAKQVSFLCGFSDPYYFSRLFKSKTGYPPSRYKASCK